MKTNLDAMWKASEEHETEGIWLEVSKDTAFRVKRFGGRNDVAIAKKIAELQKPYASQIRMGTLDLYTQKKINVVVFVETSVVDWRGVQVDGEEIPFSKEKCVELFLELPDLFNSILSYAENKDNYLEELGNY